MVSGLSADAVKGIAQRKQDALASGDIDELLRLNKSVFGGFFMGPEDDGDDGNDDNDGGDDAGGNDDGDDGSSDDGDGDDGTGGDDDDKDATVSKAEYDKLMRRMKAADQRASKAEKAEQERQRKEKSDLENTQTDLEAERTKNAELQSELSALRLNNAFLAANSITWHNPSAAMKLAQSEGYLEDVIDDDGKVDEKGLKAALNKLAKDHQYLVKKGGDEDGRGPSGDPTGRRSKNRDDKDATEQKDARRAPSLTRRGRVTSNR